MNKIAKDVFQIALMPRSSINCYLIEDVLIDAGIRSSGKQILSSVKDFEVNAHAITHAHADHQGASSQICEVLNIPFLCGEKDKIRAESGIVTEEYPNQGSFISKFQQRFWAGKGHKVSRTLKEGDKIGDFTVIETPGHATGHISFFRENDGVLIVGDVLTNMNLLTTIVGLHEPPSMFTSNQELNRKSIKKLANLQPKILCFGHGPVLTDTDKLNRFVRNLERV
jgi:glyoxylase-like metal-dependent hydrolase (beta-lactamase superfamily II)